MRSVRALFAGVLVLVFAGVAHANSILPDPGVIVRGGSGSVIMGTSVTISCPTGTCLSTAPHSPLVFANGNSFTLTTLKFILNPGGPGGPASFTCASLPGNFPAAFAHCNYTHIGGPNSPSILYFYGGPGIAPGKEFGIDFISWPQNLTAQVVANTPEPATMSLVLLGSGLVALRRRRMRT